MIRHLEFLDSTLTKLAEDKNLSFSLQRLLENEANINAHGGEYVISDSEEY
jgi:hypothetical protein